MGLILFSLSKTTYAKIWSWIKKHSSISKKQSTFKVVLQKRNMLENLKSSLLDLKIFNVLYTIPGIFMMSFLIGVWSFPSSKVRLRIASFQSRWSIIANAASLKIFTLPIISSISALSLDHLWKNSKLCSLSLVMASFRK